MSSPDPHTLLGLPATASAREVRAAYRRLAAQYHPDRHPPEKKAWAAAQMAQLNAAREAVVKARWGQRSNGNWATAQDHWRARMAETEAAARLRATPPSKPRVAWYRRYFWLLALLMGLAVWGVFIAFGQAQWGALAFSYAGLAALFGVWQRR